MGILDERLKNYLETAKGSPVKLTVRAGLFRCTCPVQGHEDLNPSCYGDLMTGTYHCYGCETDGTLPIDLRIAIASTPKQGMGEKLQKAASILGIPVDQLLDLVHRHKTHVRNTLVKPEAWKQVSKPYGYPVYRYVWQATPDMVLGGFSTRDALFSDGPSVIVSETEVWYECTEPPTESLDLTVTW